MSFATGALVRARNREWVVLPPDRADPDVLLLRPLGGTDQEIAGLLPELEAVESATFAPPDPSSAGDARSARLLRDALRLGFRSSAGPFRSFGRIAVEPRPYQLVPLLMALKLDPVRLLIADDVGIGKTIEAALIARELLDQGSIERVAVLTPPHLAEQWQAELRTKFHLDAEPVLASTARRLERGLGYGESLFERHPHVVVSTDFIKAERRRDDFVRTCPELVIVDEAHTFAFAGGDRGRQLRHELLKRLVADPQRHLILVTATPHSGKDESFSSLLELLDPALAELPVDLAGTERERDRVRLARHLVQRRRGDVERYLDTETPFPQRQQRDATYALTPEYRRLFDRALAYARETVRDPDTDRRRQRVQWWSALALLRAIGSSPAAAAATLRNRARTAAALSAEEVDELGQVEVLDQPADGDDIDLAPGARTSDDPDEPSARRSRSWFDELAREADALAGERDPKLAEALKLVRGLVRDGYAPIVFCRFIPTAEYVAEHLRAALGSRVEIAAVTGTLAATEREQRVEELGTHPRRVLVATDCLSEGINLQERFDAVVHYDLSWNPTRHEQREGRVDRYGQRRPQVRVLTYFGEDNPIDGIVLEVLLRKHEQIRRRLGVSVPVPVESGAVMSAIMEGLLTRGRDDHQQLRLDLASPETEALAAEWEAVAQRESSRSRFAQHAIDVEAVRRELAEVRRAVGAGVDVRRFVEEALGAAGATVRTEGEEMVANLEEVPAGLRDAVGQANEPLRFEIAPDGALRVQRTSPAVAAIGAWVLDAALDRHADPVAARCAVVRTRAVARRTTLLLCRLRLHLSVRRGGQERQALAEDARVLAFAGSAHAPDWLSEPQAEALLHAEPDANVAPELARRDLERAVGALGDLDGALEDLARVRAGELLETHRRVREGSRATGAFTVEPQLPVDVVGVYVFLPVAEV